MDYRDVVVMENAWDQDLKANAPPVQTVILINIAIWADALRVRNLDLYAITGMSVEELLLAGSVTLTSFQACARSI